MASRELQSARRPLRSEVLHEKVLGTERFGRMSREWAESFREIFEIEIVF